MWAAQDGSSNDHSSWVDHIDSDELVVPSKKWRQHGICVGKQSTPSKIPLVQSSMEEEGSLVKFVQHVSSHPPSNVSYPCLSL